MTSGERKTRYEYDEAEAQPKVAWEEAPFQPFFSLKKPQ